MAGHWPRADSLVTAASHVKACITSIAKALEWESARESTLCGVIFGPDMAISVSNHDGLSPML